jgi:hypothetical protein
MPISFGEKVFCSSYRPITVMRRAFITVNFVAGRPIMNVKPVVMPRHSMRDEAGVL